MNVYDIVAIDAKGDEMGFGDFLMNVVTLGGTPKS